MDVLREQTLLLITAPLLLLAILIELGLTYFRGIRAYSWRETLTNGYLALLNGSLDLLLRAVLVLPILHWCWDHRMLEPLEGWLYWVALFVVEDFAYYALHFVDHHCRFFWAVHVTHHSSPEFNLSTGFRSSVFQPVYRTAYFAPIALMGFAPMDILLMYALTQIYGSLIHTQQVGRLGWLEAVLVTPSHHRVHHASNPKYLDKNMGMCLILWDKLFGTFQEELEGEPVRFGLTKPLEGRGPLQIVFHEWRDLLRDVRASGLPWRERLGFLYHGPGWRPAGPRQGGQEKA